jgi:Mg2+/Co2+ transporter CorB
MTDIEFWLLIIAIFILILISAFFSSSETALTAASDARMHQLSKKGDKRASIVKDLRSNRDLLISTLLIGNNAVNVLASALATGTAITLFGEGGVAFAAIVMTLILVIFAEVLPKSYAFKNSDIFSLRVALPVKLTVRILKPISQLIGFTVTLFFKQQKETTNSSNMEEELRGLIKLHSSSGDNSDRERGAMLSSVLDLKVISVEEIMKHRSDVAMIDYNMNYSSILKQVRESSYTRHPVFSGKVENIIGVLHVKDLLKKIGNDNINSNGVTNIGSIISQVYFVPETTTLYDQLQAFRKRREHFAVVVDEYGDFRGIITLEDILEEIVGEIDDEYDDTLPGLSSQKDGSWIVKGDITIRDLNRTFDMDLPDEEASTIAGLVMYESRSIPSPGQEFRFHNLRIRILNKEQNKITSLRLWFHKKSNDE